MRNLHYLIALVLIGSSLAACVAPTSTPNLPTAAVEATQKTTGPAVPEVPPSAATAQAHQVEPTQAPTGLMPLAVNLTWHMHQPFYYKDENGVYSRPWVRVHATKDYLDMAELIARYPGMKATINITPSLIEQLDDFTENGAKDIYWVLAEKPAASLSDTDKSFIMQHFFDVNWDHIIARFPRYKELLNKRGGTDAASIDKALTNFKEEDWRDLQVWFNLAWVDPGYLALEPFKALVDKGKDFSEEDKKPLFDGILALMKRIIPTYKDLQDKGILEITTTPYAHPILPLILNMDNALEGNPKAIMPLTKRQQGPLDADSHLAMAVEMYRAHFGRDPKGLWPGEGAVSEDIIPRVTVNGFSYIQTGEPILVRSLGLTGDRFERDENQVVIDVNNVYKPYLSPKIDGNFIPIFFRDWVLSDKIGFDYAAMPGKDAARDLISRLEAIQAKTTGLDKIVTIVVDGENCWENYDMDGKEFLTEFYQRLSTNSKLTPTTPSAYLNSTVDFAQLEHLFPGAWFSTNYDTWIGEQEEADGWELLAQTRNWLAAYAKANPSLIMQTNYQEAYKTMLQAEGSDWFWWYGIDQDSGQDAYFDEAYRTLLKKVYTSLGQATPENLDLPIVPAARIKPGQALAGVVKAVMDGKAEAEEWKDAGVFQLGEDRAVKSFHYGMDDNNLYLRFDLKKPLQIGNSLEIYLNLPAGGVRSIKGQDGLTRLSDGANLGLILKNDGTAADGIYLAKIQEGKWQLSADKLGSWSTSTDGLVEAAIPLTALGNPAAGTNLPVQLLLSQNGTEVFPKNATFELQLMRFGPISLIVDVTDPSGDDKGPGSYTYPKDSIFIPGVFDLTAFSVGSDGANLVFTFELKGPITNGWNSPNGYSVQTFDVYIDKDPGKGTGERLLLPGRNAALPKDNGWEVALWAEGWQPKIVLPGEKPGNPTVNDELSSGIKQVLGSGKNAVIVMVPLTAFGEGDPQTWAYAATVTGQEGYPAEGVWRIRDVKALAEQYKFGGGTGASNETRILDFARPAGMPPEQYSSLSNFKPSKDKVAAIPVDDFAIVPMLLADAK
jgi:alpha-amylase/alpha-mannosidase (GH57 family)